MRLLTAILLLCASPLLAGTITVSNLNDSGAGSLRTATAIANVGDTIVFSAILSGGSITLSSGPILFENTRLTIVGAGDISIDGSGSQRIFEVQESILTIDGLTFQNGFFTGVINPMPGGGAIGSEGSDLILSDCIFRDNEASFGGAILLNGGNRLSAERCLFQGNRAFREGGAIHTIVTSNHVQLLDCEFSSNQAPGGSAVKHITGELLVERCAFIGNQSSLSPGYGGALSIDAAPGRKRIRNSTFEGNVGYRGAGLDAVITGLLLEVTHCTAVRNEGLRGSGMFIGDPDSLIFANNIVANNIGDEDIEVLYSAASSGGNVIGSAATDFSIHPSDAAGTETSPLDANPGALGNYGGLTPTVAIGCGPAVNRALPAYSDLSGGDQRGLDRNVLGQPDAGAFEVQIADITVDLTLSPTADAVFASANTTAVADRYQLFVTSLHGFGTDSYESTDGLFLADGLQNATLHDARARAVCDDGSMGPFTIELFNTLVLRQGWTELSQVEVIDMRGVLQFSGLMQDVPQLQLPMGIYILRNVEGESRQIRLPLH